MILKGADLPIEQAVIFEESYCVLHGVRQIIDVAQEKQWAQHCTLGEAGLYCHLSRGLSLRDHSHHAFGQVVGQSGVNSAAHAVVVQLVQ